MGRNQTRSDLERRVITYVRPQDENRFIGLRIFAWLRESMSVRTFDLGLGAAGVSTALASVIFAGVMVSGDNTHPTFGGAEYLLLFTRPLQPVTAAKPVVAAARHREFGVDYTTTGSIGTAARQNSSDTIDTQAAAPDMSRTPHASVPPRQEFKLANVSGGVATIMSPQGSLVVETGSLMPNGDLVVSIDRRAGRWVVVTSGGLIEAQ